jgi:hypothetical protein
VGVPRLPDRPRRRARWPSTRAIRSPRIVSRSSIATTCSAAASRAPSRRARSRWASRSSSATRTSPA